MANKLTDFFTKPVVKYGTIGLLALGLGAFATNYLNNKAHNADIAVIEAQSAADSLMYTNNIARVRDSAAADIVNNQTEAWAQNFSPENQGIIPDSNVTSFVNTNYVTTGTSSIDLAVGVNMDKGHSPRSVARINAIALDNSKIKGSVTINYHTDTIEGN